MIPSEEAPKPSFFRHCYRWAINLPGIGPLLALPLSLYRLPALRRNMLQLHQQVIAQGQHLTDLQQQSIVHSQQLVQQKQQSAEQEQGLIFGLEQLQKLDSCFHQQSSRVIPDDIYRHLQEQFRGSQGDLEKRLQQYVPLFQELSPTHWNYPLCDLGCGRGEWLNLLFHSGVPARGIDNNVQMIDTCRARNLDVVADDAFDFLSRLPDSSVPAITAIQVVEHLSPPMFIQWLKEIYRVLRPGGILLFETPNPENIQVSSYYFRLDPTHVQPLPPPLATHTASAIGFEQIKVLRPEIYDPPEFEDPRLNHFFSVSMDYAVVARKPGTLSLPEQQQSP